MMVYFDPKIAVEVGTLAAALFVEIKREAQCLAQEDKFVLTYIGIRDAVPYIDEEEYNRALEDLIKCGYVTRHRTDYQGREVTMYARTNKN